METFFKNLGLAIGSYLYYDTWIGEEITPSPIDRFVLNERSNLLAFVTAMVVIVG